MTIIDSHAHLYLEDFDEDIDQILQESARLGISEIYMPNIDSNYIQRLHDTEAKFPQCKSMMGLHPCYVKENYKDELDIVEQQLQKRKYAAVGEIGIDLFWDKSTEGIQREAFIKQIEWAKDHDLAINIHSRDALDLTIQIVSEMQNGNLKGIFHCFNGSTDQGKKIQDVGFYMGLGGVITYKNAGVAEQVAQLPLKSFVIETDAPYLSPGPKRVKRNSPVRIPLIIDKMEEIFQEERATIAEVTTKNCREIFAY